MRITPVLNHFKNQKIVVYKNIEIMKPDLVNEFTSLNFNYTDFVNVENACYSLQFTTLGYSFPELLKFNYRPSPNEIILMSQQSFNTFYEDHKDGSYEFDVEKDIFNLKCHIPNPDKPVDKNKLIGDENKDAIICHISVHHPMIKNHVEVFFDMRVFGKIFSEAALPYITDTTLCFNIQHKGDKYLWKGIPGSLTANLKRFQIPYNDQYILDLTKIKSINKFNKTRNRCGNLPSKKILSLRLSDGLYITKYKMFINRKNNDIYICKDTLYKFIVQTLSLMNLQRKYKFL